MEPKIAEISQKHIEEIQALERKLGSGVCLVAVEKQAEMYAIEAKLEPNIWERVDLVYPQIDGLKAFYENRDDAHTAKAALKSLLNNKPTLKRVKKPIRLRKIS